MASVTKLLHAGNLARTPNTVAVSPAFRGFWVPSYPTQSGNVLQSEIELSYCKQRTDTSSDRESNAVRRAVVSCPKTTSRNFFPVPGFNPLERYAILIFQDCNARAENGNTRAREHAAARDWFSNSQPLGHRANLSNYPGSAYLTRLVGEGIGNEKVHDY
jgi:hypothetical protein